MATDGHEQRGHVSPGRHELPRQFVIDHQRKRVMDAMAQLCLEHGYEQTSVTELVKRAKVARNTFYQHFDGKEDCFLGAFDSALSTVVEAVRAASEDAGEDFVACVHAGMEAVLNYVVRNPGYAKLCLVDAPASGSAGMDRYGQLIQRFASMLERGRETGDRARELPASVEETLVGGVAWIIHQRIVRGEAELVEELLPELVQFIVTPYAGQIDAPEASDGAQAREPG